MIIDENMRVTLGVVATILALYSYILYFRDIFLGKTKPHAISWLIWGLLMIIGFAGQVSDSAGPGAWVTGFSALVSLIIALLAVKYGEKNITRSDWYCLWSVCAAIPLWIITSTPLWSMVLITIIDLVGFVPTLRKSYYKPYEETAVVYALSAIKQIIGIFALTTFSIITVLYPLSLVIANMLLVVMLIVRRQNLLIKRTALEKKES